MTEVEVEALLRPESYPEPPASVELRETHISWLLFAGDTVYKIKKPKTLPFLDYSTPQRRLQFCEEEVRLNRRLAPDVYRGVVPIVRTETGDVVFGAAGTILDHAVEMARLPEAGMLDGKLGRGEIDNALLDRLARLLAAFHANAATGPGVDEYGDPEAVRKVVFDNLEDAGPFLRPAFASRLRTTAERFFAERSSELRRRVAAGRVREGHGDLHAANVCVTPKGIVVYDCIEFDKRLRCGDVALDLAFLAMDLDARGFFAFSEFLARRYAQYADDEGLFDLLSFFKIHRACIRGTVGHLRAREPSLSSEDRDRTRDEAAAYFRLAVGYTLEPCLVCLCGLPGAGKSFLAKRLALPLNAALHRSDVVRKRLAGTKAQAPRAGYLEGIYSPEWTARTYEALLLAATRDLEAGRNVVVDAAFPRRSWREAFRDAAADHGAHFLLVHVEAEDAVVERRLKAREDDPREISDARTDTRRKARATFEPPDELTESERLDARGDADPGPTLDAALQKLRSVASP